MVTMSTDSILSTERLTLRYARPGDLPFLLYLWTDAAMTRYTGGPRAKDLLEREFAPVLQDPQALQWDLWTVEETASARVVGQAGFIPKLVDGVERLELNYYIAQEHWGKGYALEIARALVAWAFTRHGTPELIAIIAEANAPSLRVASSLGMRLWQRVERPDGPKLIYRLEA